MTWEQDDNNVPSYSIANRKFNMNNSNRMNFMNDLSNNELSIFSKQPFGNAY
jgi:hypothetical protein